MHLYKVQCKRMDSRPALVVDSGSYATRAGLSSGTTPTSCMHTCIGYPKSRGCSMPGPNSRVDYIGEEAQQKRGILMLTYPVKQGMIRNWDDMEKIWKHIFELELRVEAGRGWEQDNETGVAGLLLSESPTNINEDPKGDRERVTSMMFEYFDVRRLFLANQAVLSLYASGRTTGVAVDCGHGVTHAVPVYGGYSMPHATKRTPLAGHDLNEHFIRILTKSNIHMHTSAEQELAVTMKEQLCYVSMNFTEDVHNFAGKEQVVQLPDMSELTVHSQQICCPELMFTPSMCGLHAKMWGLHELTIRAVRDVDSDLHLELRHSVVLSGGSSAFTGMGERLETELRHLTDREWSVAALNKNPKCRAQHLLRAFNMANLCAESAASRLGANMRQVIGTHVLQDTPSHMKQLNDSTDWDPWGVGTHCSISAWNGGSILSQLSTFSQMWINSISPPDANPGIVGYDDVGPRIVHQMCNI